MADAMSPSLTEIIRLGDAAVHMLGQLGVRDVADNRVARSLRVLKRHQAAGPTSALSEMRELVAAEQNALEAFYIVSAAGRHPESGVLEKLDTLLRGQIDPDRDSLTHVRDIQFELFVWALTTFIDAGPSRLAEPDVTLHALGGTIGIAAKRPSNMRALVRHLKKGADQVRAAKVGLGVLAVNADAIVAQTSGDPTAAVSSLAPTIERELDRVRPGHQIGCIFVVGTSYGVDDEGFPKLNYDSATRLIRVRSEDQHRISGVFRAFGERVRARLRGLVLEAPDLSTPKA